MNDAPARPVPAEPAGLAPSRYGNLDVPSGPELDDVVQLAAHTCGTPVAMVTVVDQERQFFKARVGTDADEGPLDVGFCPEVVGTGKPLTIPDTAADPIHAANPATLDGMRFYAGVPLVSPAGEAFGTLCVLDHVPRVLTRDQHSALGALARQVMTHIELRHVLRRERESEMRHRLIVDSAIEHAIIGLDRDGRVTDWNAGAERILGWTAADMLGQTIERLFTPEDRDDGGPRQEMQQALDTGRAVNERWHVKRDGSRFWASGDMTPILGGRGEHAGFLAVFRDHTAKRRRERRFALLAEAAAGLLKAADPDQVLGPILEQSKELSGSMRVTATCCPSTASTCN